jgi:hypothetical protein
VGRERRLAWDVRLSPAHTKQWDTALWTEFKTGLVPPSHSLLRDIHFSINSFEEDHPESAPNNIFIPYNSQHLVMLLKKKKKTIISINSISEKDVDDGT